MILLTVVVVCVVIAVSFEIYYFTCQSEEEIPEGEILLLD